MRPDLIISGGQTGGDQGVLAGAERLGIPTGGWMPKGFLTESGPNPLLAKRYGLKEHTSPKYPPRTHDNAKDSDGTAWFGHIGERGYYCTLNGCKRYDKPFRTITTAGELYAFVNEHKIKILNGAGNRESKNPGVFNRTADMVVTAFSGLLYD